MGSSSPLKMQLQFWNYCQVAMETCILAFSGILVVCILFRHFLIFPQRVVHGVVDRLKRISLYMSVRVF